MTALRRALPIAVLAAVLTAAGNAAAHGYMVGSAPPTNARLAEPPAEIVVRMSEPILLRSSDLQVLDREGRNHAVGAPFHQDGDDTTIAVAADLRTNATYVAIWSALWISDGHLTHGGVGFVVGNATPAEAPTFAEDVAPPFGESAARAAGFAAIALAFGPLLFALVVWRPIEGGGAPRRVVGLAATAAVVGAAASVAAALAGAATAGLGLHEYVTTRLGVAFAARHLLLLAAAGLALVAPPALALIAVAGAAATHTATSHAYATGSWPLMAADLAHILAGSAWVGGLVALLVALPVAKRRGALALRWSGVALGSVALVVLTGVAAGVAHLGSVDRLFATTYGRILLLKLALVAAMLLLGGVNRVLLLPGATDTPPPAAALPRPGPTRAMPLLRRVVAAEVAAGFLVLAVAGALAGTGFEAGAAPDGFSGSALSDNGQVRRSEGMIVALALRPAEVGLNSANVTLAHAEGGAPVETATRVQLVLNKLEEDGSRNASVPVQSVDLTDRGGGSFTGNVTFALPGLWKVTAIVARSDAVDDGAAFLVRIR